MNRLATLFVALLLALGLAAPAAQVVGAADDASWQLLGLINQYRADNGLGPLTMNDQLTAAAQFHSDDMAANNYFAHTLANGESPGDNIRAHGFQASPWGENIAAGMENPADTLVAWENSPGHDAMLRNPNFSQVGIGRSYADGTQYGWYWTADFGGPSPLTDAAPAPADGTGDANVLAYQQSANPADAVSATNPSAAKAARKAQKASKTGGTTDSTQSSNGGNSTADAAPPPIVLGDLNLTNTNTTINAPTSSSTVDSSGDNAVSPPPSSGGAPVATGNTGTSGVATASGNDGTITYNASDDGNGNTVVTGSGNLSSDSGGGSGSTDSGSGSTDSGSTGSGDAQAPTQQVATCDDYATWYDAQTAYEAQGGVDGDPAVVNSLDPDWDGISCEWMMQ